MHSNLADRGRRGILDTKSKNVRRDTTKNNSLSGGIKNTKNFVGKDFRQDEFRQEEMQDTKKYERKDTNYEQFCQIGYKLQRIKFCQKLYKVQRILTEKI